LGVTGALHDALPAAGGNVRMRASFPDVGGDHRVHVSGRVNALSLAADTPLDDLSYVHKQGVTPFEIAQTPGRFSREGGYHRCMAMAFPRPGARLIHALDVLVVVWLAGWVVLALFVAREVRDLRQLSDTVVVSGVAVEQTGDLIGSLSRVPFVGSQVSDVADRVREAGRSAQASGRESRDSTTDLSILLALAIGLVPTVPLLGLYTPLRITWTRESRAVRAALRNDPRDVKLTEFLARRAVATLPYHELRAVSADPFGDLADRRFEALAGLELARLGVDGGSTSSVLLPKVPTDDDPA
jgi:hypothetical protein